MIFYPSIHIMEFWFLFLYISDKIVSTFSKKYRTSMPQVVSGDIDHFTEAPLFRFFLKSFFNINLGIFGDLLIFLLPIYEFVDKIRLDLTPYPVLSVAIPFLKINLLPILCILCSLNILKKLTNVIFFQPYLHRLNTYKLKNSSLPNPHPKSIAYWHKIDQLRRFLKDRPVAFLGNDFVKSIEGLSYKSDAIATVGRRIAACKVDNFVCAHLPEKCDSPQSCPPSSGKAFFTSVQEKFTRFYSQKAFDLSQDYQDSYQESKTFLKQAMQSISDFYQEEVLSLPTDTPTLNNQNAASYCAYNLYSIDELSKIVALASSLDGNSKEASRTYQSFMQRLQETLETSSNNPKDPDETLGDSFNEALQNLKNKAHGKNLGAFNFFYSSGKPDPESRISSHLTVQKIIYKIYQRALQQPKPKLKIAIPQKQPGLKPQIAAPQENKSMWLNFLY
ncbi:MAG: hypothetical protein VX737_00145 [Pseudomonadota bacterium]|nr:hypothetical protein [Pseudomonadota bacterium]